MTDRMNLTPSDSTEAPGPLEASDSRPTDAVSVVAAITVVSGVDPSATLEAVARQDVKPTSIRLVGGDTEGEPRGVVLNEDLAAVVAELDSTVDYVWILHGDAEPRPDALRALIEETERIDASLAGSKLLVGGTQDTLESVGSATDVFGEPYSGLDEGEVDLEQYDVVRDVAFVSSVSMLVRRDLLRGLGGVDSLLAPTAAGLDLSQRVRIAGGRVIVVPSSEVFHQRRCGRGDGGWREQSGRLRAMIKAYRPVTLVWMLPFYLLTGILDSLGSLLLGRWRLIPRYVLTWAWNIAHLSSTISSRRTLARVRQVGDEELFRYQVRGSVRLRQVGAELSDRVLTAFDEDSTVTRRASELWSAPSTWGFLVAAILVVVGLRSIFLGGLPVVRHSLPFEDPFTSLSRFAGGWNASGLGSPDAVHPSVVPASLVEAIVFGSGETARSILTFFGFLAGVTGLARLAARLGVGSGAAYLAGVASLFGMPAAMLAADGRWSALMGAALLPWALVAVTGPRPASRRRLLGAMGLALVTTTVVTFFVPALGVVPLLFALAVKVVGRFQSRLLVALVGTAGAGVGLPYLHDRLPLLLDGAQIPVPTDLLAVVVLAAALGLGMVAGSWRAGLLAAGMSFGGITIARAVGSDIQEALLAVSAVGVGLAAATAMRTWDRPGAFTWLSRLAGAALVVISLAGLAGGRAGMPADQWGEGLDFIRMAETGAERVLLIAADPARLPGESRQGPGFFYRTVDARGVTLDQGILPEFDDGDAALGGVLEEIASGATLRPGEKLSEFGIHWLVVTDEAAELLRPALDTQVDLNPFPFAEGRTVYENTVVRPVAEAEDGTPWERDGTGFVGPETSQNVRLAIQGNPAWGPLWQGEGWAGWVSGQLGYTTYRNRRPEVAIAIAAAVMLLGGAGLAVWGRRMP